MQIPKRDIEARLIAAGREEFLDRGFAKATMRHIAGRAGVSLGNVYNYFQGKKELFTAIVLPVHRRVDELMADFFQFEEGRDFRDPAFVKAFVFRTSKALTLLIQNNRNDLILLLDRSGDTPFEGYKMRLTRMIERDFREDLRSQKAAAVLVRAENGPLFLIAKNLVEGIIESAKQKAGPDELQRTLRSFFRYHIHGLASLLPDRG